MKPAKSVGSYAFQQRRIPPEVFQRKNKMSLLPGLSVVAARSPPSSVGVNLSGTIGSSSLVASWTTPYTVYYYSNTSNSTVGGVLLGSNTTSNQTNTFSHTTTLSNWYWSVVFASNAYGSSLGILSPPIQATSFIPLSATFWYDFSTLTESVGASVTATMTNMQPGYTNTSFGMSNITVITQNSLKAITVTGALYWLGTTGVPFWGIPSSGNSNYCCAIICTVPDGYTSIVGNVSDNWPSYAGQFTMNTDPGINGYGRTWSSGDTGWMNIALPDATWGLLELKQSTTGSSTFSWTTTAGGIVSVTGSCGTVTTPSTQFTPMPICIGTRCAFTSASTASRAGFSTACKVGEVVIANNITSAEISSLRTYLITKWGV